jgi:predicted N-formylglutamate amidohydrolase
MPRKRSHADPLSRRAIVLSCEHAGNAVPRAYRHLFAANRSVLTTHRGYDIGIVQVAWQMAAILGVPLLACRTSRLLIEPNRSLHHRELFSEFSRDLPAADKTRLIEYIWRPHRDAVTESVVRGIRRHGRVLHLALHSFTPVLEGRTRTADIGLLYDPKRLAETQFALALQQSLQETTGLRIRRNYPYRGAADGLTTALRRAFGPRNYVGLEIELNQDMLLPPRTRSRQLAEALCDAMRPAAARLYRKGRGAILAGI